MDIRKSSEQFDKKMAAMSHMIDRKVDKYNDLDRKVEKYNQIFIKSNKNPAKKRAFTKDGPVPNLNQIKEEANQLINENINQNHGIDNFMADIKRGSRE